MALPMTAGTYGIDTMHSQLGFAVTHLGISTIRGTFDRFRGTLTVGADLEGTSVAVEADMDSINSGNRLRDEHVHGADWLDIANHPTMSFRSSAVEPSGVGYRLWGKLSLRGVTLPVVFDARFHGSNPFPMDGSTHFGFGATGSISRAAFGMGVGAPVVSDEVLLHLDVQFILPAVAP